MINITTEHYVVMSIILSGNILKHLSSVQNSSRRVEDVCEVSSAFPHYLLIPGFDDGRVFTVWV